MLWQKEGIGKTLDEVAQSLCVDKATVSRTLSLFHMTGSLKKKPYPKDKAFRKLTIPCQFFIMNLVIERPGIYLRELQDELKSMLEVEVSLSAICKFLHQSGLTRQKMITTASQRDELLREQFISDVSVYNPDMLVFIDETGADRRNLLRSHGYSIRGKPLRNHTLLVRGERVSAVACISIAGLLDVKTVTGNTDGDTFYDFVQAHLLPILQPYNGSNPHSVVIMDNCSIHHVPEVVKSITDVGALVHFLPPYSPDLAPIEETFSKVKTTLKSIESGMIHITDIETLVLLSFTEVTPEDCKGWIYSTGVYY